MSAYQSTQTEHPDLSYKINSQFKNFLLLFFFLGGKNVLLEKNVNSSYSVSRPFTACESQNFL